MDFKVVMLPFKDPERKKKYKADWQKKRHEGPYTTIDNITYPSYLDEVPFPKKGHTYIPLETSHEIGRRRVREFRDILPKEYPKEEGYSIKIVRTEERGLDVHIWKDKNLHTVIELTNYGENSYMPENTALRYLKNFKKYPKSVKKILVVSFKSNIYGWKKKFQDEGVQIRVMGYQAK